MPSGNRKSRVAKQKRQEGHGGYTTLADGAVRPPSPNSSDYCKLDDGINDSTTDADSSDANDERGTENNTEMSVIALQHLYAIFCPPHLRPDEDTWEKHRRIRNRPLVYTRDSRTTAWWRDVAQKKAAQGCTRLDGFIWRKVC